jgi:alanine racemase
LYGYNPLSPEDTAFEKGEKLQPALSLSSVIVALNQLEKGEIVSYNGQWENQQAQQITATVPFGYAEGLPRKLSGKLFFRWNKELVPQI